MDYTLEKIKQHILDSVIAAFGQEVDRTKVEIEAPPNPEMGDLAVPCFYFTKINRLSPNQIAADLKEKIRPKGIIKKVENIGPYLNFTLSTKTLAKQVLKEVSKLGDKYGSRKLPKAEQKKVMLEYSGPNTHKEIHIGHMRNNSLGIALVNLLRFSGQKVLAVNYIGDIGSHVAKCLWALEKYHAGEAMPENKGKYLGAIYAEAVNKIEEQPELAAESAAVQQKLESGDKRLRKLWKQTRQWSLDELMEVYEMFGAKFDHIFYESEVEEPGKKIVAELLEKGVAEKSQGAVIIDLEKYGLKQFLLLKSDGTSLYSTKELALAKLRFEKYKADQIYLVIDVRQSFYMQQFIKTLEVMGFDKKVTHVPYEFVTLKDGAMSSRKGNILAFEDFFAQVVEKLSQETKKRHTDWAEKLVEENSRKIALAAIKFYMLRTGNTNVITFDLEDAMSYDGFTGPYLQYTVSRINSLLNKEAVKGFKEIDVAKLKEPQEKELLLEVARFPEVAKTAAASQEPSQLAKYLFDLAKIFSGYYQAVPILGDDAGLRQPRLLLCFAVRQALTNGLSLLGIETVDQM